MASRSEIAYLVALLLAAAVLLRTAGRAEGPRLDPEAFASEYKRAVETKDLAYFDALLSRQFWLGNRLPNREAALGALRDMFEEYDALTAEVTVLAVAVLPGGDSCVLDTSLSVRGRRRGDGSEGSVSEATGACVFVREDGRWRLYKTVEKRLCPPDNPGGRVPRAG
jgi:ketosteroid isomerase-like protein